MVKSNQKILDVRRLNTVLNTDNGDISVVTNLSYHVNKGQTLGIIGQSGSGKTVSILSLLRLLPTPPFYPPQGKVIYNKTDLFGLTDKQFKQYLGPVFSMVFQNPMTCLNPVLPISQQLIDPAIQHLKIPTDTALNKAHTLLTDLGLDADVVLHSYPHNLSGGMRQRVALAVALMTDPRILIVDEPTTALDIHKKIQVIDLLEHIQAKYQLSMILISHDIDIVRRLSDDILVMYESRGVEFGNKEQVISNPKHNYTKALLNSEIKWGQRKLPKITI